MNARPRACLRLSPARLIALASCGACLALGGVAHAGNSDTFFLGNDAAMQGGAVTATTRGGSAVWYNPAGLAVTTHDSVDVSASAYLLRFGGSPDLKPTDGSAWTRRKLSTLDLSAVPTAFAIVRRISGWTFGLGLFVPNRVVETPRTSLRTRASDTAPAAELTVDDNDRFTEYYAGLSVGHTLSSRLRLGVSVFGYYSSAFDTRAQSVSSGDSPTTSAYAITHSTLDQQRLGLQVVWGLQWDAAKTWHVGFVFRSPVFQLYQLSQLIQVDAASNTGGAPPDSRFDLTFAEKYGIQATRLHPMRAHVGVSHEVGSGSVAVDASLQPPFHDIAASRVTSTVVNGRAGGRMPISENVWVGAGVFTDLAPTRNLTRAGDAAIDYYGASIAIDLATPYNVLSDRAKRPAPVRSLIMSTTLALSYAFGTGRLANLGLAADGSGALTIAPVGDNVTVHEFVLHIGSTLLN